ncbi:hypothetical protein HYX08_02100 [Candidatus Woesearchaeota archaeon]|nr:hypothetical protein [Candidatus Woesearchaeota archaeon]
MRKLNRFFVAVIMFLLLLNAAYAFDVKANPIKDKIVVDEVAEFEVTISNNFDTDEEFTIKKAGYPFWDMYTKPLQNPITLKVPAMGSSSIKLFVDPLYITSVDTYTLDMGVVLSRTGQEQKVPITIGIKSTEPLIGGYIPTVLTSVDMPSDIDPRDEFRIKIALNNQNVLDYPNLTIKIESNLFKDEIHIPLGPKEEKNVELSKKLDPMTPPQEDRLIIAIFKEGRLIVSPIVKEFKIREYLTQEELPKEKSFLKIKRSIKVVSNNPDYSGTVKIETTPLKNLLLTSSPRSELTKENGKQYLTWNAELGKDNMMLIYVYENYRPIVVIVILTGVAILLYFLFRSPIVVRKSIANIGMSEGGISEAKVVVRVKNRSPKQIANIEVIDNLPNIAHVEKELSIGSMQPHAILRHPKKGIMIKWNVESLEAGDERVLSYRMKSRLSILGEFNLPAATARCAVGKRTIISNSNRVSVGV